MADQKQSPKFKLREQFERLAPCPRCQRSDNLTTTIENPPSAKTVYFVECQACENGIGPKAGSYKEAFAGWNRFSLLQHEPQEHF